MALYGHIPGFPEGSLFPSRKALSGAGLHRPLIAGIWGSMKEPARSIVLSGGYEDDEDDGQEIIYTGQGGQDPRTKRHIKDQELTKGNMGLALSRTHGTPVRVIRGADHRSPHSPTVGYRYSGLFKVVETWREKGRAGFYVWRFKMIKDEAADGYSDDLGFYDITESPGGGMGAVPRRTYTITRVVRDNALTRRVKAIHNFTCQVCGVRLVGIAGPYAEGAHIRPLGRPHHGYDELQNLLCLCPNHHVLFDLGAFTIAADYSLIGMPGKLRTHRTHPISPAHLAYNREQYFNARSVSLS
jgi:putative restriction endonuclease